MNVELLLSSSLCNGLIVDANLLVLYLMGQTGERMVEQHKRTSNYTVYDLRLLKRILERHSRLMTTPHILAEVSNLARFPYKLQQRRHEVFEHITTGFLDERRHPGKDLCESPCFRQLGITDSGIWQWPAKGL